MVQTSTFTTAQRETNVYTIATQDAGLGEKGGELSISYQAFGSIPPNKEINEFIQWEDDPEHRLRISGLHGRCSGIMEEIDLIIDFSQFKIFLINQLNETVQEFPDDVLTNFLFYQDSTGHCHISRWNPFGTPPFSKEFALLLNQAMRSKENVLRKANIICEVSKSCMPKSLFINSEELKTWLRKVIEKRRSLYVENLREVIMQDETHQEYLEKKRLSSNNRQIVVYQKAGLWDLVARRRRG